MKKTALIAKKQETGQVLQFNISRHVAESWFVWSLWSISFVWFEE